MMIPQTALETAVLDRFHELHGEAGFPSAASIQIVKRENTGGGRYVDLDCDASIAIENGYFDLCGGYIEMKGLPNGMMAVVFVKDARLSFLEFAVYGGEHWDGEERDWKLV